MLMLLLLLLCFALCYDFVLLLSVWHLFVCVCVGGGKLGTLSTSELQRGSCCPSQFDRSCVSLTTADNTHTVRAKLMSTHTHAHNVSLYICIYRQATCEQLHMQESSTGERGILIMSSLHFMRSGSAANLCPPRCRCHNPRLIVAHPLATPCRIHPPSPTNMLWRR